MQFAVLLKRTVIIGPYARVPNENVNALRFFRDYNDSKPPLYYYDVQGGGGAIIAKVL